MEQQEVKPLSDQKKEFLLTDLAENGPQTNFDWNADLRFATRFGYSQEVSLLESITKAPSGDMDAFKTFQSSVKKQITKKRVAVLRGLVKDGKVESEWTGTGKQGHTMTNLTRVRQYKLI